LAIRSVRYLLVRVGQDGVDHRLLHPGLPQPFGGQVGVPGGVFPGAVLVQVMEQAGQRPAVLVLTQAAGQGPHHPLDRDQVADGDVLVGLVLHQGPRVGQLHDFLLSWPGSPETEDYIQTPADDLL
jgi:hypothetical protein